MSENLCGRDCTNVFDTDSSTGKLALLLPALLEFVIWEWEKGRDVLVVKSSGWGTAASMWSQINHLISRCLNSSSCKMTLVFCPLYVYSVWDKEVSCSLPISCAYIIKWWWVLGLDVFAKKNKLKKNTFKKLLQSKWVQFTAWHRTTISHFPVNYPISSQSFAYNYPFGSVAGSGPYNIANA